MKSGKCERYFISDLGDPDLICDAVLLRWSVEQFHKDKDMFLKEDGIRYTNRNAVSNMVILNNLAMQLVRIYEMFIGPDLRSAKAALRYQPVESISMILSLINSELLIDKLKSTK